MKNTGMPVHFNVIQYKTPQAADANTKNRVK